MLESTTYPGTTRERLVPLLEESGLAAGRDFHVAFRRSASIPGRSDFTLRNTVKVVGGLTDDCAQRRAQLYERSATRCWSSPAPEAAELSKLLENIFRSVNIALVNELAVLCDRMGIDIWEVIDAAATKPFGFMRFDPGPGMGGHCLPVDPFYLAWKAREYDFYTEFIELAGKINQSMPYFCVDKIERTLNDHGKPVHGSRILLLGVAYKPGVGDLRAVTRAQDPEAARRAGRGPRLPRPARAARCPRRELESTPLDEELEAADLVVIVTAHPRDRLPARGRRSRGSCSTSAASRAGSSRQPGASVTPDNRKVAVGVVGLGYWGPNLARNFAALEDCELRWCCDRSERSARALARARFPARASRADARRSAGGPRARRGRGRDRRALACAARDRASLRRRQALLRREAARAVGGGGGGGRGEAAAAASRDR